MGPLLNIIGKIKGHLKGKALCKGGSPRHAGVIRYVAKSFKFFGKYVARQKNVVKALDYVPLGCRWYKKKN